MKKYFLFPLFLLLPFLATAQYPVGIATYYDDSFASGEYIQI